MRPKVHWLHSRRARDRLLVGGKAANLARLVAWGFRVPPGFSIPVGTTPCRDSGWESLLRQCLDRIGGPVAVRSSLVGEDHRTRSFAGQLDTVLGIDGPDALLSAIDRVIRSARDPHLRAYLAESGKGIDAPPLDHPSTGSSVGGRDLDVGVLVQKMVPAKAAGVAFSADPLTGMSTVVIEAVPRLGEELVQGRADPDRFVIDPRGALVLEKRKDITPETLSIDTVLELGRVVRQVASCAGIPQDVEWAWDGKTISLLQARPITSLAGRNVYSRKLVGDMSPGPIKLLVWSTNTIGMIEGVFGTVFSDLIGPSDNDFRRILKRIRSRAYVNTTFVGGLLAEIGLPRNLFEAIAREETLPRGLKPNRKMLAKAPRILAFAWRHARMDRELHHRIHRHQQALAEFRSLALNAMSPPELLRRTEDLLELHRDLQWSIMIGSMNLGIRTRLLKRFVTRRAPDVDPSRLLVGLKGIKSVEPNLALRAIAEEAAGLDRNLQNLVSTGTVEQIRKGLADDEQGAAVLKRVDGVLERFKYLSANGTNFGEPSWEEEPGPVWKALGWMLQAGPSDHPDPAGMRKAAREQVLLHLGPLSRLKFRRQLGRTARYLELRETVSILMTEDTYILRRLFLNLGRRMVEDRVLEEEQHIFHLTMDEVRSVVGGSVATEGIPAMVAERRREFRRDCGTELPETIVGEEVPTEPPSKSGDVVLTGIGASAGVVEGTARVIRSLDDAPAVLCRDDVLVVPFSDVGWTPLFATVGGIVAECGGQLSHTAIVAREYGLPAVVAARGAMREITEGQRIRLDGGMGRIDILHPHVHSGPEDPG